MKKTILSAYICLAFCAVFLLCLSDPVQAGKYIYFDEKGEQVESLSKGSGKKRVEKVQMEKQNLSENDDTGRAVDLLTDLEKSDGKNDR